MSDHDHPRPDLSALSNPQLDTFVGKALGIEPLSGGWLCQTCSAISDPNERLAAGYTKTAGMMLAVTATESYFCPVHKGTFTAMELAARGQPRIVTYPKFSSDPTACKMAKMAALEAGLPMLLVVDTVDGYRAALCDAITVRKDDGISIKASSEIWGDDESEPRAVALAFAAWAFHTGHAPGLFLKTNAGASA